MGLFDNGREVRDTLFSWCNISEPLYLLCTNRKDFLSIAVKTWLRIAKRDEAPTYHMQCRNLWT